MTMPPVPGVRGGFGLRHQVSRTSSGCSASQNSAPPASGRTNLTSGRPAFQPVEMEPHQLLQRVGVRDAGGSPPKAAATKDKRPPERHAKLRQRTKACGPKISLRNERSSDAQSRSGRPIHCRTDLPVNKRAKQQAASTPARNCHAWGRTGRALLNVPTSEAAEVFASGSNRSERASSTTSSTPARFRMKSISGHDSEM